MTGTPPSPAPSARVLATVLFIDLVDPTTTAPLQSFREAARRVLDEHRGDVVTTRGDGVVATFDGPGRAVHAACALCDQAASLDLRVRAGLHTAEIERRGNDIAGLGVDIASRVAEAAGPGEIWVSRTVTDLVAGTGIEFEDVGLHSLRDLDQQWTLCRVRR